MRVLLALGGNAMTSAEGRARVEDQIAAAEVAMEAVADLVAQDVDVVVTHGNGPQVGNLLVKNELAAAVVPPVPLDWCGAQTQATLGFVLMDALDAVAAAREASTRRTATVVTRTLVDSDDPGFTKPTKPIGRFLPAEEAQLLVEHGETWEDRGEKGWRRVVASPEPLEIIDAPAVQALVDAGFVVVANGGGGIPVVRDGDGTLRGVEAVIDKDLGAALLARSVDVDVLVIATDVPHAVLRYGTPEAADIGTVTVDEMRAYAAEGHFASGSMGPKVDAVCRFVEQRRQPAIITDLANIVDAVRGDAGTVVVPNTAPQQPERGSPMPDAIEVRKVPIHSVADASELAKLIDDGVMHADRVIAIIGKTEGNGGVNDYTRIIADRAFREVLVAKGAPADAGQAGPDRVVRRHRRRDQPARHDLRDRAAGGRRAVRRAAADRRLRDERAAAA